MYKHNDILDKSLIGTNRNSVSERIVIFEVVHFCTQLQTDRNALNAQSSIDLALRIDSRGNVCSIVSLSQPQNSC